MFYYTTASGMDSFFHRRSILHKHKQTPRGEEKWRPLSLSQPKTTFIERFDKSQQRTILSANFSPSLAKVQRSRFSRLLRLEVWKERINGRPDLWLPQSEEAIHLGERSSHSKLGWGLHLIEGSVSKKRVRALSVCLDWMGNIRFLSSSLIVSGCGLFPIRWLLWLQSSGATQNSARQLYSQFTPDRFQTSLS